MSRVGSGDCSVERMEKATPRREEEEEEDEEDFLPTIPESVVHLPQDRVATTPTLAGEDGPRKRSRSPLGTGISCDGAADHTHRIGGNSDNEDNFMELLNAEEYPGASLYERSYRHDHALCDIAVVHDENGVLIVTVDAFGTMRAWRKLPRGVFFMGENHGLFPRELAEGGERKSAARYYILTDPLRSCLLVVRVTLQAEVAADTITVVVEVRQVNSAILRVETRLSFCFTAPLRSASTDPSFLEDSVNPRPFLLFHDYQPFIAFFTAERGVGGRVVLIPWVSGKNSHPAVPPTVASGIDGSNGASPSAASLLAATVSSVPLSTANPVACCQQHRSSGLVVLVDVKGIIDYARITAHVGDDGRSVVSLRVVPGAPRSPGAPDSMMLRQWITFERRQRTGFFTLLREADIAAKTGRSLVPLSVGFSSTGGYFAVVSGVLGDGHVCVSVHLFDFASGAFLCRGETEKTEVPSLHDASAVQSAVRAVRAIVLDVVVEEAVRKAERGTGSGIWVFLPEFAPFAAHERRVSGRCITVFRASPAALSSRSDTPATQFLMKRLPHPIGDVEKCIRETTALPTPLARSSSLPAESCWNIAMPLKLLRVAVPASQSLKNLVAQSRLGSDLSLEDLKRLFVVPGSAASPDVSRGGASGGLSVVDPIFLTTSLGGRALIVYTKYEASLGTVMLMNGNDVSSPGDTNAVDTRKEWERRERVLSELHQKRDFNCADLMQLQSSVQCVVPLESTETNGGTAADTRCDENNVPSDVQEERGQRGEGGDE